MAFDLVSRVLFPTPESSYTIDDFPEELIWVPRILNPQMAPPEDCIPCLFLPSPSARFLVFYLHSNAEDLGRCYPFCALLRHQFQVHVLAVEYPGYGLCPGGQADGESVTANAFVAFRFIREVLKWPLDGILVLGRSIGTGPALAVAAEYAVYGLILVSPFTSVQELCRDIIGPLAYLIDERFPNKERMAKVRSPMLLVHGKKDAVVPVSHGEKLYEVCRAKKRLVCPELMEHNTNLHTDASYFVLPMLQFYGLPDYCFDEIEVPKWVCNKRLCIHYRGEGPDAESTPVFAYADAAVWCDRGGKRATASKGKRSQSEPPKSDDSFAHAVGSAPAKQSQGRSGQPPFLERNPRTVAVHNLAGGRPGSGLDQGSSGPSHVLQTGPAKSPVPLHRPDFDDSEHPPEAPEASCAQHTPMQGMRVIMRVASGDLELPAPPDEVGYIKVPCSRWVDSALAPASVYAESTTCTENPQDQDMIGI